MNTIMMGTAGLTRFVMRWTLRLAFVVCLLLTNVAGVLVPALHAAVTGAIWAAASHSPLNLGRKPVPPAELQRQLADADRRTATIQADLDKKTAELQTARTQRGEIDAERRSLAAQLDTARSERAALAGQLNSERLSREVADANLHRIRTDGDVISARMQERITKSLARSSGITVLEAIPFVGTVAVVGGIAVDLYDTCQQVDDLREIRGLLGDDSPMEGAVAETCAKATGPAQRVPQADFDFDYSVPTASTIQ